MENTNFIENAVELLKKELELKQSPLMPMEVLHYLIEKCENDEEFSKRVLIEKKSYKECTEYVLQEVMKLLNKQNGHLADPVVYGLAESYYILDEVKIDKPEVKQISIPTKSNYKPIVPTKLVKTQVKVNEEQISLFGF